MRFVIHKSIAIGFVLLLALSGCGAASSNSSESRNLTITRKANLEEIGQTMTSTLDNSILVYVPAGEFLMGTETGLTDEQPIHKVYLDSYWIDQTEVTNAMYSKCVEADKCAKPSFRAFYADPEFASHPVEYVSWQNAVSAASVRSLRTVVDISSGPVRIMDAVGSKHCSAP